ncbi:uncharacterized protein PHACADRAFT_173588 [Phanerochaete carnosa HHB-10118-sp]|uniref:Mitochondrial carrier protein n=1 Tax=Phanerochaete carnosa (strain HHB-10118-sp) TaxID=650164 RepID=K5VVB7_PHACS|nr:uncharacterized protein PHACADRAFT_173588 [Phanerochaete carnosa HHB-10118-sp]EKM55468.1 hypothetical protein PHACADRAFT_173588 [Phanerochaete carnosa HHB-10118-sp]
MSTAHNKASSDQPESGSASSLYAAIARSATRSMALYFSRPIYSLALVNGWQTLRLLATQEGHSLTPQYMRQLVRQQGVLVIAKHFIPPITINLVLGSVLWTTYSEATSLLESHINSQIPLAAASGALAGGAQALLAAPAENVRFVLEGGSPATGWSYAWKEVFRGTSGDKTLSKRDELHQAREVRDWMREVSDMAGRGWHGWKWGVAKDACGFAVFFTVFEMTRRLAVATKTFSQGLIEQKSSGICRSQAMQKNGPRVAHALTLVTGGAVAGLAYEMACRPWDIARKAVHVDRVVAAAEHHSVLSILLQKFRDDGWTSFFKRPTVHEHDSHASSAHRRLHALGRTLGRVGPWGIGFLAWEAFGPGLS